MEQELAAVIRIEDPLRDEAVEVSPPAKKRRGLQILLVMTGDSERTAGFHCEKSGRG